MYYLKHYGLCDGAYLCHHGVKGQEWGVRRGPPYPIETGYKKGSKVHSTSFRRHFNKRTNNPVYVYDPNNEHDSAVYKGPFAKYALTRPSNIDKRVYDKTYKIKKDLKMPTQQERKDEFFKMINNNPEYLQELKSVQDAWRNMEKRGYTLTSDKKEMADHEVSWNNIKKEDRKTLYLLFNSAMENYKAYKSTKKYVEIMSTKYDAMVDDNNAGIYNDALDPVIIFNSGKNLKLVKVREIPMSEINTNYKVIESYMNSKGKRPAL